MMTFLIFIVALSVLVFVHEWGHFIAAKRAGIRVDIFSIGFGPKIFSFKWHGTEYRIAPIPFGGYVKIYGQEPMEDADGDPVKAEQIRHDPQSYSSKSVFRKLSVLFAGPLMNVVWCFALMPLVFMVGRLQPKILDEPPAIIDVVPGSPAEQIGFQKGDLILSLNSTQTPTWRDLVTQISLYPESRVSLRYRRAEQVLTADIQLTKNKESKQPVGYLGVEYFEFLNNAPKIESVLPDSPAQKAGLQKGDVILSLNSLPIKYWTEMARKIQENEGKPLSLVVLRDGSSVPVQVTPQKDSKDQLWFVGVLKANDPSVFVTKRYGPVDAVVMGLKEGGHLVSLTFDVLGRLFTGGLSFKTLGGPLQIAQATSSAAQSGFGEFLYLLGFISLQLGIMNLLPIPVLDGGHIVFTAIEGLRRKPLSLRIRTASMNVGLVLLVGLVLFVTVNDVDNIWGISKILIKVKTLFH